MADVVFISIALLLSLLHQNHIGVTYVGTSNFRMELVRFVHYTLWQCLRVIVIELPFVSTPVHIVDGFRSRTQTLIATKIESLHEDILRKVNNFFVG
jgi:hypothetical protein